MVESLLSYLGCPLAGSSLDQSLLPVLEVTLVVAMAAMLLGISIAERVVRSKGSAGLQAGCRLHDWIRLDDGHFICLQCSYQAGSSRQPGVVPRRS